MCSQSISTLIKLTEKSINIQQHPINIVRFVCTPRFVFKQKGFNLYSNTWMLVLAHALPTRISPRIAYPIVTFLSSLSNSTSGVLITSVVEYVVLIVLPPSIYIGPMWRRKMWKSNGSELSCKSLAIYAFLV